MHRLILDRSSANNTVNLQNNSRDRNEYIQKLKFIKIYRKKDDEEEDEQTVYNLQEILGKSQSFLNDKVFEINVKPIEDAPEFKYVHLKIKKIKNERTLIQLIDISDKMLYNVVKAEQNFSTLMNAAVSHELRNPLNSLIGGIQTMKAYLSNLKKVIESLEVHP